MYKPGAILKVTVKNFVTYTYAEIYPGPNLNMLLGPNGTGKSTIVAAIILGLGGNPKIIGRGTKVSEYVKHECSEASIDILMQGRGEDDKFNIIREFNIHDKNTWKLNDKKLSFNEVHDYIKEYNIQVDNLCQFLPQDKVQDFARMNKQELLKQTKKALCREDLLEKQQQLIEKEERHKLLLADLRKQSQKLQECRDATVRLEGKVKNYNKKKMFLKNIKNIERKIAWLEYESLSERREEIKNDKAQAAEVHSRHLHAAKPMENAISYAKKDVENLQMKIMDAVNTIKATEGQLNDYLGNLRQSKDSANIIINDMQAKLHDIEQRKYEINSTTMKLDQLNSDRDEAMSKYGTDTTVSEKIQRYLQEIKKISSQVAGIEQRKNEVIGSKQEITFEIRNSENELRRIENVKQQRLQWLRRSDPDAYNATLWLRENKHLFQGEIYEPMMLELNVTNVENAIYIENTIPIRDRVAFTCTLKEDMNLLIRSLRDQQKLTINVVHSGNEQPPFQAYQPPIAIEQLNKYGLYAYLHSLFTGPEPVMKYLCKSYRIHCTPVGGASTSRCFEDVPKEITNFFSDKFRFSTSYSKYTGEKSTRQNEIRSDGSLSVCVDAARLEFIRGQLREAQHMCETYTDEIREIDNQVVPLKTRNSELHEQLQILRNSHHQIEAIESRIRVVSSKLQQLKEHILTKEDVHEEARREIQNIIKEQLGVHVQMKDVYKGYTDLIIKENLNVMKMNMCRKQVTFMENKALDIRRLCQDAEETLNHIKDVYNRITVQAKTALQKAKQLSNGYTPTDKEFQEFRQTYDSLSDHIEELETEKNHILSKIDCLQTANDGEMREYEDQVQRIENLEEYIRNANVEINEINKSMGALQEKYMESLQELVGEISQRFSAAFERMGFSGEVIIYTGENDKDYEQYGLSIRVTYRNGEPLQALNSVTQSGGERAVATATYMLALQELTPVPFRCVDEINQGMDATNERRIFDLLVESTSQPNTPQYFLITPKLIPNLKFGPSMKIHTVFNGPFTESQKKWNNVKM